MICRDTFQTTDGDRFCFDAATSTSGLTRSVADATQDAGEYVGFTVDEIRGRELPLRNQADVFGNIRMGGTRPLAIDDAMIIVRISSIGWLHRYLAPYHDDTALKRCRHSGYSIGELAYT